jgi:hypothetical protein
MPRSGHWQRCAEMHTGVAPPRRAFLGSRFLQWSFRRQDLLARRLALGRAAKARKMADPARFELTTSAFGGQRSIQLSYGSGARNIPEGLRRRNAPPPGVVDRRVPIP